MTMTTSRGDRPTFAQWLAKQLVRADTDPIGWLARGWKQQEGPERPKVSSPTGIARHMRGLRDEPEWRMYLDQAITMATEAYRAQVQAQSLADHQPAEPAPLPNEPDQQPSWLEPPAAGPECTHGDGCPVHPDVHAVHGDGLLPSATLGHTMPQAPPTMNEQGWAAPQEVSWLAGELLQIKTQLGLVMQMLAVSSPAAAQVLIEQLSADAEASDDSTSQAPIVLTEGQQRAASIAQANGWVPADQPPMPTAAPAGSFEAWWGVADPAGDGDG